MLAESAAISMSPWSRSATSGSRKFVPVICTGVSMLAGPDEGVIATIAGSLPPGAQAATATRTSALPAERTEPPFIAGLDAETVELTDRVGSFELCATERRARECSTRANLQIGRELAAHPEHRRDIGVCGLQHWRELDLHAHRHDARTERDAE